MSNLELTAEVFDRQESSIEDPSLFNQIASSDDFSLVLNKVESNEQELEQELAKDGFPLLKLDFGESEVAEVAQLGLPDNANPTDFAPSKLGLDSMRKYCPNGSMENPVEFRLNDNARTLFYKNNEGISVAVKKEVMLIQDPGAVAPTYSAEVVKNRFELHTIAPGVTAIVDITPPADEVRTDHHKVSSEDGYQITVVDETTGEAYKYSHMQMLNDRSGLKRDLDLLRNHHNPVSENQVRS